MPLNLLNKLKRQVAANGSADPWLGDPLPREPKVKTKPTPEEESLRQQRAQAWKNDPLTKAELAEARVKGLHMEVSAHPNKLFGLVAGALAVAAEVETVQEEGGWMWGAEGYGYYRGGTRLYHY